MSRQIKVIIFDWAGTTIDFGSNAPVTAFKKAFEHFGIIPTIDEIRAPMGMQKRAHIEAMLRGNRLSAVWFDKFKRPYRQSDINDIYNQFEPALFAVLKDFSHPLPGVLDTAAKIKKMGIQIGSTTGYTSTMMEVVAPAAKEKGYEPDCLVCPDEVGGVGRPYPYMIWRNMEKMGIPSIHKTIKIGDTSADMEEGKNAGCITVGVMKGSNIMGLSEDEYNALSGTETAVLFEKARQKYITAGADYVIENISLLPSLIETINQQEDK